MYEDYCYCFLQPHLHCPCSSWKCYSVPLAFWMHAPFRKRGGLCGWSFSGQMMRRRLLAIWKTCCNCLSLKSHQHHCRRLQSWCRGIWICLQSMGLQGRQQQGEEIDVISCTFGHTSIRHSEDFTKESWPHKFFHVLPEQIITVYLA